MQNWARTSDPIVLFGLSCLDCLVWIVLFGLQSGLIGPNCLVGLSCWIVLLDCPVGLSCWIVLLDCLVGLSCLDCLVGLSSLIAELEHRAGL